VRHRSFWSIGPKTGMRFPEKSDAKTKIYGIGLNTIFGPMP
jgi:hypothetical protein